MYSPALGDEVPSEYCEAPEPSDAGGVGVG